MSKKALIVAGDSRDRQSIHEWLIADNYEVSIASSWSEGLLVTHVDDPSIIFCDKELLEDSRLDFLKTLHDRWPRIPIVLLIGLDEILLRTEAIKAGAFDCIAKPVIASDVWSVLSELSFKTKSSHNRPATLDEFTLDYALVGHDEQMREIYRVIGCVVDSNATLLITGESGTGKELIARAIHYNSSSASEPFIAINCTALTETLLESELFGHVKGAFTGALSDKKGKFELAGSGTIFLDEIGDISPAIQVLLLRVLQEREFEQVGGERTIPIRARIIAATNKDLEEEIQKGKFRSDLYYRLNVVSIHLPPLRERLNDVPVIAEQLLQKLNHRLQTHIEGISDRAMQRLLDHSWPGNVRELENTLVRAIVLAEGKILDETVMPFSSASKELESEYNWNRTVEEVERDHIMKVLEAVQNDRDRAAKILGISKPTLYSKLPSLRAN